MRSLRSHARLRRHALPLINLGSRRVTLSSRARPCIHALGVRVDAQLSLSVDDAVGCSLRLRDAGCDGGTSLSTAEKKHRQLPLFQGVLPVDRSRVPAEVIAGVTLAALGIPEVMGYTTIAGMPVITGLYTILIPIAVFAVIGSSRHLVVGADSASAAIMAAGIAGLAPIASPHTSRSPASSRSLTGAFLLLARIIRLGFLADFLSRSVLIGFLTGVGIQVAIGQVAGMFGVPGGTDGGPVEKFIETLSQIPSQTSWTTAAVSASILGVILGLKALTPKIPGALIAVIGAIARELDLGPAGARRRGVGEGAERAPVVRAARLRVGRLGNDRADRRVDLPRRPRAERGHVARLRGEVRGSVRREPRPGGSRRSRTRRPASPARSS